jgi:translation initiation factor IF-2
MFDERGNPLTSVPPSTPVSILGLDGAPQAGDNFHVLEDEKKPSKLPPKEHSY